MKLSELEALVARMRMEAANTGDEDPDVLVYNPTRGKPYFYDLVDYPDVSRIRATVLLPGTEPVKLGDFLLDTRPAE